MNDEQVIDSALVKARAVIDRAMMDLSEGRALVSLEDECIDAVSVIRRNSEPEYVRLLAAMKVANARVPTSQVERLVRARMKGDGTPHTHGGYAQAVLDRLTSLGWRPVADQNRLYVLDPETSIWEELDQHSLQAKIVDLFDGGDNCSKRSDYAGIAQLVLSKAHDPDFFANMPSGVACGDKFYSIVNGALHIEPLKPDHRQLYLLPFAPTEMETPLFSRFLAETFASDVPGETEGQISLLREFCGATMLGTAARHEKVLLMYDPDGRAGKGTTERILRRLVPSKYVKSVDPFMWGDPRFLVQLAGARLNSVGELSRERPIPAAIFKLVTGRDSITARQVYEAAISFHNTAAHVFMSNHLIKSNDRGASFFDRWLILHYQNSRTASGKAIDVDLAEKIIANEMPGIALWAMQGADRLARNKAYTHTVSHDRIMAKWRLMDDSLAEFINEACELGPEKTHRVPKPRFWEQYRMWCGLNGHRPYSRSEVKLMLENNVRLGVRLAKHQGDELFLGVRFKVGELSANPDF